MRQSKICNSMAQIKISQWLSLLSRAWRKQPWAGIQLPSRTLGSGDSCVEMNMGEWLAAEPPPPMSRGLWEDRWAQKRWLRLGIQIKNQERRCREEAEENRGEIQTSAANSLNCTEFGFRVYNRLEHIVPNTSTFSSVLPRPGKNDLEMWGLSFRWWEDTVSADWAQSHHQGGRTGTERKGSVIMKVRETQGHRATLAGTF